MITLIDGPAAGDYQTDRAPRFLRAVTDPRGGRHCLDLPHDLPEEEETLHIYRRVGDPFTANVCGPGRSGKTERFARYRIMEGVEEEGLRDPHAWAGWCRERSRVSTRESGEDQ